MLFARQNWVALLFFVAVIASFVVSNQQSAARDSAQRAQLIAGCARTGERSVLDAAYKQKTSDVRRAAGGKADIAAANAYQQFALGGLDLIALPRRVKIAIADGRIKPQVALLNAVVVSHNSNGDRIYQLSPAVKKVVREGCAEAYA